ncbi:hypothetical protein BG842_08085 [Haladaptatus sp. W1]|nr:hypothetical protein BG842_08085 [Haladaptatus sp. W1]
MDRGDITDLKASIVCNWKMNLVAFSGDMNASIDRLICGFRISNCCRDHFGLVFFVDSIEINDEQEITERMDSNIGSIARVSILSFFYEASSSRGFCNLKSKTISGAFNRVCHSS